MLEYGVWNKKGKFRNGHFTLSKFFRTWWPGLARQVNSHLMREFASWRWRGQVSTSPLPLVTDRKLALELFGNNFHGTPAGAIFLNLFMNLQTCSLPASTGKWTFSHKVRIQLPCLLWSLCKKNLESIKYQFLNSPLLFLTSYSNKYWSVLCFEFLF